MSAMLVVDIFLHPTVRRYPKLLMRSDQALT
jgi:hypothetical protein